MNRESPGFSRGECQIRIAAMCYEENGYFYIWDSDEDYALLAEETGCTDEKIRLIVSSCLRRSLFDDTLFKVGNVLTSRGIQRRYFSAVKDARIKAASQKGRYTYIEKGLCLLTEEDFSELNSSRVWLKLTQNSSFPGINDSKSGINPYKSENNPPKESKVEESKVEESKVVSADATFGDAIGYYMDKIQPTPSGITIEQMKEYAETMTADVIKYAIDKAITNKVYKWNYINAILIDWQKRNVQTMDDVHREEAEYERDKYVRGNIGNKQGRKSFSELIAEREGL